MTPSRLIMITGMPGAGKTTLTSFLRDLGFMTTTMGDVIRDIALERGLEPSSGNLGRIAEEIRSEEGPAAVARRCIERLGSEISGQAVVDGIRSLEEVEEFRRAFDAVLVAIHASPRIRFDRLRSRGRSDDPMSWDVFTERDVRELGFGTGSSIAMADIMLVNEGTLEDLRRALEDALGRLENR